MFLSFKMMAYRTSSMRAPAANAIARRLQTAALLKRLALPTSDCFTARSLFLLSCRLLRYLLLCRAVVRVDEPAVVQAAHLEFMIMKGDDPSYAIPAEQIAYRGTDYRCSDKGTQNDERIGAPAEKERDRPLGGDEKH